MGHYILFNPAGKITATGVFCLFIILKTYSWRYDQ